MNVVEPTPQDGATVVIFAKDQPEYTPLPALVFPSGHILVEWALTEEERTRIAQGENIRHWILKPGVLLCPHCQVSTPCLLQPTMLEITDEHKA